MKKLKKKLIILLHGPLSKREFKTFGIKYLKKKFNLLITEISPLVNSSHYKFKRHYKFKIINNFSELEHFFSKNKNSMCWETGFSYNSLRVFRLLKKYNIKTISADGISSLPTQRFLNRTRYFELFLRRLKLLTFNPIIFLNRISFSIEAWLRILRYKFTDIALIGGKSYEQYNGYINAKEKIYCASLDYGTSLNVKKKIFKKKFAVFVDTYLPFHPEHSLTTSKLINVNDYFNSLTIFFEKFQKLTKLDLVVALYPKAELKRYPKKFKKFKIIKNKVAELIKGSEIVLHHGSTAHSYAAIYKKPVLYLTTNFIEKIKHVRDNSQRIEFLGSQTINIDSFDETFFLNSKKLFYFNKELYKNFVTNYLKHNRSKKEPWYISFNKHFNG